MNTQAIDQALEDKEARLLAFDQQLLKVKKLHDVEKREFESTKQFKIDIESDIERKTKIKDALIESVKGLTTQHDGLLTDIAEARRQFVKINTEMSAVIADIKEKKTSNKEWEDKITAREIRVSQRESEVKNREALAEEKHEKIRQFANQL